MEAVFDQIKRSCKTDSELMVGRRMVQRRFGLTGEIASVRETPILDAARRPKVAVLVVTPPT
jgi:hypothetical protein